MLVPNSINELDPALGKPKSSRTPAIKISNLEKSFLRQNGEQITPVNGISLDVAPGEFVVLLGPSGCGKTTLLRCIAGLEEPDRGQIALAGETVYSDETNRVQPPEKRSASVVFQSYALWPHMTVFKNVAYPLRKQKLDTATIESKVRAVLEMVGVRALEKQYPGHLSGGQQQRVALARALVADSSVVLFDEPLSNVDAKVRDQLRLELLAMQRDLGFAALYVTHDQVEAMELGHRIAVLRDGQIEHLGPPSEIYQRPASRYVANFIGRANEIDGRVVSVDGEDARLSTEIGDVVGRSAVPLSVGEAAVAILRPEDLDIRDNLPADSQISWPARVTEVVFGGAQARIELDIEGTKLETWRPGGHSLPEIDSIVYATFDPERCWLLPDDPLHSAADSHLESDSSLPADLKATATGQLSA